jgi:hypothetical protein
MEFPMKCPLCNQRNGKRYCPGVRGYICTLCCGQEREVSVECPLECVYLQDAYRHEAARVQPPDEPAYASHGEIEREFVAQHGQFLTALAVRLMEDAFSQPGTVDADLRSVLDALIRTRETLSSGLIYETLPEGLGRTAIYRDLQDFIETWKRQEAERTGMTRLHDSDVLKALVFLGRMAHMHDNQRPRGKAFLALLRRTLPQVQPAEPQSVIIPGA